MNKNNCKLHLSQEKNMTLQTQHTIIDMDIAAANSLVDNSTYVTHLMEIDTTMQLLRLLAYDIPRLKILASIIENTILYCNIILLPNEWSPFSIEDQSKAASAIEKHREILSGLQVILDDKKIPQ